MILIYSVTLFLMTFTSVNSDKGCPYGWYLSDDESTCYVNCFTSHLYSSNVYCNFIVLKSLNFSYDSSTNYLTIPSGERMGGKTSLIPWCYNVTLQSDQYEVTSNGFIRIASYLMEIPPKNVIKITLGNVTLCYPSSPQLLQCDALSARLGSYKIINGTILMVPDKDVTAFLGDFYVNEEAIAFFCAQSSPNVSFTSVPRCNMAVLQHTDYVINSDGSMTVIQANATIKNPLYSINYSEQAIVCLPLTPEFLNCPMKTKVAEFYYKLYPNLTLLNMIFSSLLDSFDYYITIDSQLNTCVDPNALLHSALVILQEVCNSFYLLSSLTLLLTVVLRFRMFIQNYHGLCLLFHVLSLAIMCVNLGTPWFFIQVNDAGCYVIFVGYYFFNMAAFLWLNVIAYDSWRFFSRIITVGQSCVKCNSCWLAFSCVTLADNSGKRFTLYNAFCWGLAAILTIIILVLDLCVSSYDFSYTIRPYILPSCFFATTPSFVLFFCIPLTVTTMTNLIFLGLTIRIIHRASLGTEMVNVRRRMQVFKVSIKLFLLMGLCWTVDCFCFAFSIYYNTVFLSWYWFLAIILTSLQGLVVSVIYCAGMQDINVICTCRNKLH